MVNVMSGEKQAWRTTAIVLTLFSIIIGIIQRSSYMFLDPKFEVCVFHIPTAISLIIYSSLPKTSSC
jgi:hypothetical protein